MEKKDIVIIGAGGLGREILWLLEENNKRREDWNVMGFIDSDLRSREEINGYPILGDDEWLVNYNGSVNAVCAIAAPAVRRKVINGLREYSHITFPTILAHTVVCSDRVELGQGTVICCNTVMTVDVSIGEFVVVNPGCFLGHDVVLEDYVTLYPQAAVCGAVHIEEGTQVGVGAKIIQGKTIGRDTIIGAGSVVIGDIPSACTAVGNPCRVIKVREEGKIWES